MPVGREEHDALVAESWIPSAGDESREDACDESKEDACDESKEEVVVEGPSVDDDDDVDEGISTVSGGEIGWSEGTSNDMVLWSCDRAG